MFVPGVQSCIATTDGLLRLYSLHSAAITLDKVVGWVFSVGRGPSQELARVGTWIQQQSRLQTGPAAPQAEWCHPRSGRKPSDTDIDAEGSDLGVI